MYIQKNTDMAALLSELPISKVITDAEQKHGFETHMVIECVSKEDIPEFQESLETEDSVYWWVEFEDQIKTFETFSEVEKFLLEDAVSSGEKWKNDVEENHKKSLKHLFTIGLILDQLSVYVFSL
jgi:hypothetical protein